MLMCSVSGVRGVVGSELTPEVAVRHAAAFGTVMKGGRIVVASDTRPTGPMIREAVISGLLAVGCDVVDIGVAPTPTVPLAVTRFRGVAGLAVTASHNPIEWNALKFLGSSRAILPPRVLDRIYRVADSGKFAYRSWRRIGRRTEGQDTIGLHVDKILRLRVVDRRAVAAWRPAVVYDAGGGAGSAFVPVLLQRLGCRVHKINCTPGPRFPRGPEPVPRNLKALGTAVRQTHADIGFATDPDSDRLAIVDERGRPLGEEQTLVLAVYWVLSRTPGPVVINLSTSRAVMDVASAYGQRGYTSKVGEVNVAQMMKIKEAIIGGEGNGGVIMPALHPGRDALLGMALVLSLCANAQAPVSDIIKSLPTYHAAKKAVPKPEDYQKRLQRLSKHYLKEHQDHRDGVKIDFGDSSIHARASNTEPILRISTEAKTPGRARTLLNDAMRILGL